MTRKISLLVMLFLCYSLTTIIAQDNNLKIKAKPKNMWEVGLHLGHTALTGDVDWNSNFGVGLYARKSLDYTFSIRLDAGFYNLSGEEEEDRREVDGAFYGFPTTWQPEYESSLLAGDITFIASLNQIKVFKKNKINPYFFAGAGIASVSATAINGSDEQDVAEARNFDDDWDISPYGTGGFGVGFLIGKKVSLSIEHKVIQVLGRASDLLDGVEFQGTRRDRVITKDNDLLNYTNVRLGIALGKKGDDTQMPLWWSSPLDMVAEDLAEVKARPVLDLTDTDGDGVIDMQDQEKGTRADCPVDVRGVILDSDNDGVVDCDDKERYSPPGYKVDSDGVADIPKDVILSEGDVNRLIDAKLATMPKGGNTIVNKADWFLPMIHFNNDKYSIKNTEYGKLHHVAEVMKKNPDVRVVVTGHTDKTSGNCYNDVLSYNRSQAAIDYLVNKYGISRSRLILNWGGENTNLVPSNGSNLMNRRVEFAVASSESDMGRPDCGGSAGSGGTNYSGNKEAGY